MSTDSLLNKTISSALVVALLLPSGVATAFAAESRGGRRVDRQPRAI